jgi:carbon monoxide dehydrogenase subunit G
VARVARTFTVQQPIRTVVDYLADFAHTEAWDPGTESCARTDSGDLRVGSTWHNVSEFRGRTVELDYELTRYDDDHLVFTGRNDKALTVDDLGFAADGDHATRITYAAEIRLQGWLRLGDPVVRLGFEALADKTVKQLTGVLEQL